MYQIQILEITKSTLIQMVNITLWIAVIATLFIINFVREKKKKKIIDSQWKQSIKTSIKKIIKKYPKLKYTEIKDITFISTQKDNDPATFVFELYNKKTNTTEKMFAKAEMTIDKQPNNNSNKTFKNSDTLKTNILKLSLISNKQNEIIIDKNVKLTSKSTNKRWKWEFNNKRK